MAYKDPYDERAKASRRKHYEANKEQYYANNKLKKQRMLAYLDEIKRQPCIDCGRCFAPFVMDLHHIDPAIKTDDVTVVLRRGSWQNLFAEIEKCVLLCSNCHRVRTHRQRCKTGCQRCQT